MQEQQVKNKVSNRGRQTVELTRKEIGILKAALQYYLLDDEFGRNIWMTIPGAGIGPSDWEYMWRALEVLQKLNKTSKRTIKEDFGRWGNIKYLFKLCDIEYKNAERRGSREWKEIMKGSRNPITQNQLKTNDLSEQLSERK